MHLSATTTPSSSSPSTLAEELMSLLPCEDSLLTELDALIEHAPSAAIRGLADCLATDLRAADKADGWLDEEELNLSYEERYSLWYAGVLSEEPAREDDGYRVRLCSDL